VALVSHVPAGVWVRADARCLRQVLINLLSNAIKYNRSAGWVSVSLVDAPPGRVVLGIEDTGLGLTDQEVTRLFQPFERLGHETSGIEGSGLGLVIARSLVEEMGGELTLSSVKDAGTLARVTLRAEAPGESRSQPASPVAAPAASAAHLANLRMLYVEDNRINALLFEEAMRLLGGVELRIAEDGSQALDLVQQWVPQVLVLDANLPDMSGFEVLRRIREIPALAQAPAYMCSADAMPEDLERARVAGFAGYWTKPIAIATLSADLDAMRERLVR
jgi:CheY-like chemotaxis protein